MASLEKSASQVGENASRKSSVETKQANNSTDPEAQTQVTPKEVDVSDEKHPNVIFWDGENDPECPMNWNMKMKITNVALVSAWTFLTPLASSMVAPGVPDILREYRNTNATLGSFVVSIYILGYAVGPLFVAPMSEIYGRLPIYHTCNVLFVIWTLACAFAPNLGGLLAFRFFEGVAGVCTLTIGSGTISDLIPPEKRGVFVSIYSLGPLLGPVVGPIAGSFLAASEGWRWVFRVLTIAVSDVSSVVFPEDLTKPKAGLMTVLTFVVMRETYHPIVLRRKVMRLRRETGNDQLRSKLDNNLTRREIFVRAIVRPTKMLCLSPIVFLLSLYMAIVYGYLYLLFTTLTTVYEEEYHWSGNIAGLAYLGIGVGMFLGLFVFGYTSDRLVAYQMNKYQTARKPEYRLPVLMIGAALVPVGLFWYGWSAQAHVHYVMPIIGTGWVGTGLILTFTPISSYLIDAFTIYAASAMAANTVLRSLVGAFLPLAGPSLYRALGLGWGNSLLGFIAVALWPVSLFFYKFGERVRTSKRFKVEF